MIRVLFVCHGNICRSPMAEFMMKDLVRKNHVQDKFLIASCATSREEIGNPVHPGTRKKLASVGINTSGKYAVQLTKADYETYDYILAMDSMNLRNIFRIIGEDKEQKVSRLLDFSEHPRDIADPWYTGDFDKTYEDIQEGIEALYKKCCESF